MNRPRVRKFEQFRSEAGRCEPYRLDLDGEVIEIPAPTTGQIFALAECADQPKEALRVLCGEHFDAVFAVVASEPIEVFHGLFSDMTEHFGMGSASSNPPGSGGS